MQTVKRFSGGRLAALRAKAELSQHEVARRVGVREKQIWRWETGVNKRGPSADAVGALAAALGCSVDEFYVAAGEPDEVDEEADRVSRLELIAAELSASGQHRLASETLAVVIDLKRGQR